MNVWGIYFYTHSTETCLPCPWGVPVWPYISFRFTKIHHLESLKVFRGRPPNPIGTNPNKTPPLAASQPPFCVERLGFWLALSCAFQVTFTDHRNPWAPSRERIHTPTLGKGNIILKSWKVFWEGNMLVPRRVCLFFPKNTHTTLNF